MRGADGRLAIVRSGSDTFAARQWLAADGDARAHTDKSLGEGIRCDRAGCVGRLADGRLIALARTIEAFEEDCRRAAVVASPREAPPHCAALVIDRNVLAPDRRGGAPPHRRRLRDDGGHGRRLRPALGAGAPSRLQCRHQPTRRAAPRRTRRRARRIWSRAIERQYRRNRLISLPWMRTRLGGRMRTS